MTNEALLDVTDQHILGLASLLGLLGDPTRLRIVLLLCRGEMNVSRLCETLGMRQPTVSHHLALLRRGRVLQTRRDGKTIHYALDQSLTYSDGCELSIDSAAGVRIRIGK